ncbi:MAG: class I SAM-dependent methyltransferase [Pirellulales bacterium]|nr:class I SAM-dependent methyltransferase [Pirellulales bacterium]
MPVVDLLAPKPGEKILDLGCGDGALTEKLVHFGCRVVGVDASAEQVRAARARGIDARVIDAHQLPFRNQFDAVFSNAALHWMRRADEVLAGVFLALKAGGRFVAECGASGNVARIEAALCAALARRGVDADPVNPWYFPTPDEYRLKLIGQGFRVVRMDVIPRPTALPGDLAGWLETFAEAFVAPLPPSQRREIFLEVQESLRGELYDGSGTWTADYVRLRFAAEKPKTP